MNPAICHLVVLEKKNVLSKFWAVFCLFSAPFVSATRELSRKLANACWTSIRLILNQMVRGINVTIIFIPHPELAGSSIFYWPQGPFRDIDSDKE